MSYNLFHNLPELARNGGFSLCDGGDERDDTIDWRFIASIDTARIIRESDFEKLDQCIPFLIRSSVGNLLNVRILDPAIARIYIISQLCLQYLLFCTKFLDKSVHTLRENIFDNQKKSLKLEEVVEKRNEEIAQLQKKIKRQDTLNQQIFSCKKCTKNFLSSALLDNHVQRKHPSAPVQESKDKDSNLINTIKLEIKQLKERLNVTEKELMDANLKSMKDCQKCFENAQRSFQSVAVQSNFEEKEKDDIEKDAIYELLNNQMKHFEEWKRDEETRYHTEIIELRTKLDQTIETLKNFAAQKETQTPAPAPRLRVISEKCVGTSKSVESLVPQPQSEDVWKSRYEELEKMYELHQQRMSSTVTSIQATYNEKMSNIEETVKQLKEERVLIHNELEKRLNEPKVPLSPKVIKKVFAHESSSFSDSDIEIKPKTSVVRSVKAAEVQSQQVIKPEKPKKDIQTYADQKFLHFPKKSKPLKKDSPKSTKNIREQAEDIFNHRLKELGISPHDERMSKAEFNRVHSDMVGIREANKKKHKSFFMTRKSLQSQVDKIFRQKNDRSAVKSKQKPTNTTSKMKHRDDDEITVIKSATVEPPTLHKNSSIVNQSFRSDLEQTLKKNLPTPIQKIEKQIQQTTEPTRDVIPPSSSKKKVMFATEEEDDSDFDLSSFPSEAEEPSKKNFT